MSQRDAVRLLLILAFALGLMHAQTTSGTISGIVFDPNDRAIPGAEILMVNDVTGITYPARTNGEGIYAIANLPPGPYRIQVARSGFKTVIKPDIVVHVADALAINVILPIGATSEILTVEGGAPLINTESASVSTIVDRQFAENLPLNGRSFQSLILLTPGVALTVSTPGDSGQFSVNGQRASANYWMVDGVSANVGASAIGQGGDSFGGSQASFSVLGGTNSLVSVDAMQEFRIQTSTYAPEFGRTPGAQVSILTRSGTKVFHGTAFDYFRNDVLDANNWFNGYTNDPTLPKARERQNDFGGTFSGPILKDRTFFFFSYEGLRLRLPQTTLTTVPDSSSTPEGTLDSRQNATAAVQPYLNAFPLPNPSSPEIFVSCVPGTDPTCAPSGQKPSGSAAFNASYSNPAALDASSLRIDHRLNERWNLFGRYSYSPSALSIRGASGLPLSGVEPARITTQSATLGVTWMGSAEATNDLRFNYSKTHASSSIYLDQFGGAVPLTSLPLPSPFTAQNALFAFDIAELTNGILGAGKNESNLQRQLNLVDSLSMQKGTHGLKFGVDLRSMMPLIGAEDYEQFAYFRDVPRAGLGELEFASITSRVGSDLLLRNLGVFAQDTWRANPRLTITYGLRWDIDFAPTSRNGVPLPSVTGFNLNDFSNLSLAPGGTPVFKTPYSGVAPRFGVAYQLRANAEWQTVLRSGAGVFYDLVTSQVGNIFNPGTYPFGAFKFSPGGTFPLSPQVAAPPPIKPPANGSGDLSAFDPNIKLPYTVQWNLALEQGLGRQQTISASYIGAAGRRLLQTETIFAPNSSIGEASLTGNAASSSYNALQLQFNRRLSHGVQALTSFTWSHSIDDGSAGSGSLTSNLYASSAFAAENRGPSDFDIRRAFNAALTYDVPAFGRNVLAKTVLPGWSVENLVVVRSAPPVNVSDGDFSTLSQVFEASVRPDLVPGQPTYLYGGLYPGGKAINPNAFKDPPTDPTTREPIRQGTVTRNSLRGFGGAQWDFAIHRIFPIHESLQLQFRTEMFNILNHPNFGSPNSLFTTPAQSTFGLSTQMLAQSLNSNNLGGGGFSSLYQLGGPRSIQFALKLTF